MDTPRTRRIQTTPRRNYLDIARKTSCRSRVESSRAGTEHTPTLLLVVPLCRAHTWGNPSIHESQSPCPHRTSNTAQRSSSWNTSPDCTKNTLALRRSRMNSRMSPLRNQLTVMTKALRLRSAYSPSRRPKSSSPLARGTFDSSRRRNSLATSRAN